MIALANHRKLSRHVSAGAQPFHLEDHWLGSISTASNKVILIFHPGTEVPIGHQDHDNLVNIMPGPIAPEFFGFFSQVIDIKLVAYLEEWTGSFMDIRTPVLLG